MMERDFIANPYSIDEIRVANYIVELTGVGGMIHFLLDFSCQFK
jgi:hypothetical protein